MLIHTNINQDNTGGNKASDLSGSKQKLLRSFFCHVAAAVKLSLHVVLPSAEQEVCRCERQEDAEEPIEEACGAQQRDKYRGS